MDVLGGQQSAQDLLQANEMFVLFVSTNPNPNPFVTDAFKHFRITTLNAFGVDPMHYITAPQMAYSLFLKVTIEGDHSENILMILARKWAQYIMRTNANEVLTEKQLVNVFLNRMGEFYESKGIRLMETNEIDDFIPLLKNLRGGITQIVKRHAKVDIDNTEQAAVSSEGIYYLDANNLYGGVLHTSNDALRVGGCI